MQAVFKQILVVEDNQYSMNKICSILKEIKNTTILKAKNSGEAYKYAMEYSIDLFIIDIILEPAKEADISGIHFADTIRKQEKYLVTPMIFITALVEPQMYTYTKLHCYDYFEKPIDIEKFKEAVLATLQMKIRKHEKEYTFFKINGIIMPVKIHDIVYIDNKVSSLCIQCVNEEMMHVPYKSSRQVLLELDSFKFLKCNKSMIVNIDYIENIDYGKSTVKLKDNFGEVKIGRKLLKSFKEGLLEC